MTSHRNTFFSGLTMGLCGKGDPTFEVNKNVLYNGVEFLEMLEYDKVKYPYAYLNVYDASGGTDMYKGETIAELRLSSMPFTAYPSEDKAKFIGTFDQALYFGINGEQIAADNANIGFVDGEWVLSFKKDNMTTTEAGAYITLSEITWCNQDLLTEDGSVYLAASEPVPATDTFTKGYLVGAELRRKRILTKKYLYNGVQLPKLPKTDADYAVIAYYAPLDTYSLVYCNVRPCYITQRYAGDTPNPKIGLSEYYAGYLKRSDSNVWEFDDTPMGAFNLSSWTPIWTNCDILADDGSVYMAAGTTNDRNVPTPPPDPQPICADKNINYLFNGIELPALPDFDIRVYPYVMLAAKVYEKQGFMIAARMPTVEGNSSGFTTPYYNIIAVVDFSNTVPVWNEWRVGFSYGVAEIEWANFNIYNADGSIYLAASEPVPVYE